MVETPLLIIHSHLVILFHSSIIFYKMGPRLLGAIGAARQKMLARLFTCSFSQSQLSSAPFSSCYSLGRSWSYSHWGLFNNLNIPKGSLWKIRCFSLLLYCLSLNILFSHQGITLSFWSVNPIRKDLKGILREICNHLRHHYDLCYCSTVSEEADWLCPHICRSFGSRILLLTTVFL